MSRQCRIGFLFNTRPNWLYCLDNNTDLPCGAHLVKAALCQHLNPRLKDVANSVIELCSFLPGRLPGIRDFVLWNATIASGWECLMSNSPNPKSRRFVFIAASDTLSILIEQRLRCSVLLPAVPVIQLGRMQTIGKAVRLQSSARDAVNLSRSILKGKILRCIVPDLAIPRLRIAARNAIGGVVER